MKINQPNITPVIKAERRVEARRAQKVANLDNIWYTYILLSLKDQRTYTGSTNNLETRLEEHNRGYVNSTRHRRPLKYIHVEKFSTETEARKREKYLKSGAGRRFIKQNVFKNTGA